VLALGAGAALLLVMALLMPPAVALYLLLCALSGSGIIYLSRLPLRLEARPAFGMVLGAIAAPAPGFLAALAIGTHAWSMLAALGVPLLLTDPGALSGPTGSRAASSPASAPMLARFMSTDRVFAKLRRVTPASQKSS